jgi:putative FmdB family regulatory protein
MPIFEFKCSKCEDLFEMLVMKKDEDVEMQCPKCGSEEFERVISSTNYAFGGSGAKAGVASQSRKCSGGSCTTYDIPGPAN